MRAARSMFVLVAAAVLAAAVPGVGRAQEGRGSRPSELLSGIGGYLLAGGGVADFTEGDVRDRFGVGGTWELRLGVGTRHYLGGELAYVGSARSGEGSGSDLLANGVEGILRLQYPIETGAWLVEPFAFAGLGYSRLSLRDAPAGVDDGDDVGVAPVGAGVTLGYRRFLVDARFTYRAAFSEDLAFAAGEGSSNLEQWAVGASLGYAF